MKPLTPYARMRANRVKRERLACLQQIIGWRNSITSVRGLFEFPLPPGVAEDAPESGLDDPFGGWIGPRRGH